MNNQKVATLINRIKSDILKLEAELKNNEVEKPISVQNAKTTKEYKNIRYQVNYHNQTWGGEKGFSKRDVFKFIISNEIKLKDIEELNRIFDVKKFPKTVTTRTYPLIIMSSEINRFPQSVQKRYLELPTNKDVLVLGEWGEFVNIEEQIPGNFPVLVKIVKKLGYKVKPINK